MSHGLQLQPPMENPYRSGKRTRVRARSPAESVAARVAARFETVTEASCVFQPFMLAAAAAATAVAGKANPDLQGKSPDASPEGSRDGGGAAEADAPETAAAAAAGVGVGQRPSINEPAGQLDPSVGLLSFLETAVKDYVSYQLRHKLPQTWPEADRRELLQVCARKHTHMLKVCAHTHTHMLKVSRRRGHCAPHGIHLMQGSLSCCGVWGPQDQTLVDGLKRTANWKMIEWLRLKSAHTANLLDESYSEQRERKKKNRDEMNR